MTLLKPSPPGNLQRPSAILAQGRIAVVEGLYCARLINCAAPQEVQAYQQLRYDYFVQQKGWVEPDPAKPLIETDSYDVSVWHLAVFENNERSTPKSNADIPHIIAYLRVLPWTAPCGFMLNHEFSCLLSDTERIQLPRPGSVELSRLVIAATVCTTYLHPKSNLQVSVHVVELLLKLLYHLSVREQIEHYYIVVEAAWLKAFTRRFHLPFQRIGRAYTFPDGPKTIAAHTTRSALEQSVAQHDPPKYQWYLERPNEP